MLASFYSKGMISIELKVTGVKTEAYQNIGVEFKTSINDPNDSVH